MPHDTDGGDIIKYHVTLIKREFIGFRTHIHLTGLSFLGTPDPLVTL